MQSVVSGVLIGGLYAIIAMGVTLNWGLLKVISLAHFSLVLLGAYMTYQLSASYEIDPFLTILITAPVLFVIGIAMQWFFDRFDITEFVSLLVTFGIFIIFQSIFHERWTADFRSIPAETNPYRTDALWIGEIAFRVPHIIALFLAVGITAVTWYLLNRTYWGKGLRAISQDRAVAQAFGVNQHRVPILLGGLIGVYAAIAGVFVALIFNISPEFMTEFIGVIFAVVILGGLGNPVGTLGAGILIGITQNLTATVTEAGYAPLVTFSLLIVVLLFRPEGLFTRGATT
jgi:branched-chain amino acid transport system permease protein